MNKIELLGRQRGKGTQSRWKQMKYEGFPQCLNFRWNEWGVVPLGRSKTMREGQQFIGHCARQCQIVATTTGFVPHE